MNRTTLEWARDIARSYRSALHATDPEWCARLDKRARELGHHWIGVTEIPAHLVDDALDAQMSAIDIEHYWGMPAATIRGWASKGLLEKRCGYDGAPVYLVREVLEVESRNRRANEGGEPT